MKNFLTFLLILLSINVCFAEDDYRKAYSELEVPKFSYIHGQDPGHFYDNQYASYSVYPLFRLSATLYFKNITITPGYYDLTPREYKGKYYLLFKTNGLVKYIVPIYKREIVPLGFYEAHLPKEKYTWTQKVGNAFYKFIGEHCQLALRKPTVKTYLEVLDMNDNFVVIVIYFNDYKYSCIFRTVQL